MGGGPSGSFCAGSKNFFLGQFDVSKENVIGHDYQIPTYVHFVIFMK